MLGHAAALYDDLTVVENVRFAVRAAGASTSNVDAVLERLGLGGRVRRTPVGRLSAGQRRRVALAALRGPSPRTVASRRAPRRARRRGQVRARGDRRRGRGRRRHRAPGLARARSVVASGRPGRVAGRRPRRRGTQSPRAGAPHGRRGDAATGPRGAPMWRDTVLVAGKDLRIELRSRVVINQVAPFGVLVLVLFAFALGPDRAPDGAGRAGSVLGGRALRQCAGRATELRSRSPRRSPRRLAPLGPRPGRRVPGQGGGGGACRLVILEVLLAAGRRPAVRLARPFLRVGGGGVPGRDGGPGRGRHPLRRSRRRAPGTRDAAPVLVPARGRSGLAGGTRGRGRPPWASDAGSTGDPWLRLLLVFAVVYLALGVVIFGPLQEAA